MECQAYSEKMNGEIKMSPEGKETLAKEKKRQREKKKTFSELVVSL